MLDTFSAGALRLLRRRRSGLRRIVVHLSGELLLDMLLAPEGMTLAAVQWDGRSLQLVVEHVDLPEMEEGQFLGELTPTYHRNQVTGEVVADWGELGERSSHEDA